MITIQISGYAGYNSHKRGEKMKILTFNVNGLRAILKKGFIDFLSAEVPDILCIQETKCSDEVMKEMTFQGYFLNSFSAEKAGYSGVATLSKVEPEAVEKGLGISEFDREGRTLTLEFPEYFVINTYSPNSQNGLARIDYRLRYDTALCSFAQAKAQIKPVILCGDFNVAHQPIDLKRPKENEGNTGYSIQERESFEQFLKTGLSDSFRVKYPAREGAYTWWSYLRRGRLTNAGWRIDYLLLSASLLESLEDALILSDVMGSDHCPAGVLLR